MRFVNKKLNLVLHISAWLLLFVLPSYIIYYLSDFDRFILYHTISQAIFLPLVFYTNYLFLAPRFFFNQKKVQYVIYTILVVVSLSFLFENSRNFVSKPPEPKFRMIEVNSDHPGKFKMKKPGSGFPVYNLILSGILMSGFGLGLLFSKKLNENEKERKEAEKEKIKAELAFLKNQINPHFFFNTLNNIYSLVRISPEDGQDAILQLSKLMRYLLYESDREFTSLQEEIDFLNHYIRLEKLRLVENTNVRFEFPQEGNSILLPPLLFVPFIENAFKHGFNSNENTFVHIKIELIKNTIHFTCSNSLSKTTTLQKPDSKGIGLENVRKRLHILLPEKHKLSIRETESEFIVSLELKI